MKIQGTHFEDEGVTVPIPEEKLEELRVRAKELYRWYYSNFPFNYSITINCYGVSVSKQDQFVPEAYLLKD